MADDELSKAFSIGFNVTKTENNSSGLVHPRFDEYKGRYVRSGDQEFRRSEVLKRQKDKRFDAINYARKLADGELDEEEVDEASMDTQDTTTTSPNKKEKRFNPYKNQLMLSEWLVDPPPDLGTDWTMVLCPTGKRLLVVAHKGCTYAYTKSGYKYNSFPSGLPGGSFKTFHKGANVYQNFTIMDCIYDETNRTYWMIDLMCYRGNPIYDSDTEFRFFWLHSKVQEDCPNIGEISSANPFKFIPCETVLCTEYAMREAILEMHPFELDGLLFYHKSSHYTPGRTPLVGWLKPHMLPSILGISMPDVLLENAPPVAFDRDILLDANKKLQDTVSDRSFNNPKPKSPAKAKEGVKMEEVSGS